MTIESIIEDKEKNKKPNFGKAVLVGMGVVKGKVEKFVKDIPKRETEKHLRYLRKTKMETERLRAKAELLSQRKKISKLTPKPTQNDNMGFGMVSAFGSGLIGEQPTIKKKKGKKQVYIDPFERMI